MFAHSRRQRLGKRADGHKPRRHGWWNLRFEALVRQRRKEVDEAVEFFGRIAARANPLGLFSEDLDARTGELLGNFPQAYTHVGLINAAMTIGALLRAREGDFHAWT